MRPGNHPEGKAHDKEKHFEVEDERIARSLKGVSLALTPAAEHLSEHATEHFSGFTGKYLSAKARTLPIFFNFASQINSAHGDGEKGSLLSATVGVVIDDGIPFLASKVVKGCATFFYLVELAEFSAPSARKTIQRLEDEIFNFPSPKSYAEESYKNGRWDFYVDFGVLKPIIAVGESYAKVKEGIGWFVSFLTNYKFKNWLSPTNIMVPFASSIIPRTERNTSQQGKQVFGVGELQRRDKLPDFQWTLKSNLQRPMDFPFERFVVAPVNLQPGQQSLSRSQMVTPFLMSLPKPTPQVGFQFSPQIDLVFKVDIKFSFNTDDPASILISLGQGIMELFKAKNIKDKTKKIEKRYLDYDEKTKNLNSLWLDFDGSPDNPPDPDTTKAKATVIRQKIDDCRKSGAHDTRKIKHLRRDLKHQDIKSGAEDLNRLHKEYQTSKTALDKMEPELQFRIGINEIRYKSKTQAALQDEITEKRSGIINKFLMESKNDHSTNKKLIAEFENSAAVKQLKVNYHDIIQQINELITKSNQKDTSTISQLIAFRDALNKEHGDFALSLSLPGISRELSYRYFQTPDFSSDKALAWYQQAAELDPTNPDWEAFLGSAKVNNYDWLSAKENLDRAKKLNPDHSLNKYTIGFLGFQILNLGSFIIEIGCFISRPKIQKLKNKNGISCQVITAAINLFSMPVIHQNLLLACWPTAYKTELNVFLEGKNLVSRLDTRSVALISSGLLSIVKPFTSKKCQQAFECVQSVLNVTSCISHVVTFPMRNVIYQLRELMAVPLRDLPSRFSQIIWSVQPNDVVRGIFLLNSISTLASYAEWACQTYFSRTQTYPLQSENRGVVFLSAFDFNRLSRSTNAGFLLLGNQFAVQSLYGLGARFLARTISNRGVFSVAKSAASNVAQFFVNPAVKFILLGASAGYFAWDLYSVYNDNMYARLIRNAEILLAENEFEAAVEKYKQAWTYDNADHTLISYKKTFAECQSLANGQLQENKKEDKTYTYACYGIIAACSHQLQVATEDFNLKQPLYYLSAQSKIKVNDFAGAKKDLLTIVQQAQYPAPAHLILANLAEDNIKLIFDHLYKALRSYKKLEADVKQRIEEQLDPHLPFQQQLKQVEKDIHELEQQINDLLKTLIDRIKLDFNNIVEMLLMQYVDLYNGKAFLFSQRSFNDFYEDLQLELNKPMRTVAEYIMKHVVSLKEVLPEEKYQEINKALNQCCIDAKNNILARIKSAILKLKGMAYSPKTSFFKKFNPPANFAFCKIHNQIPDCKDALYEVDVPGDGSCWLYASVLAVLLPILNQPALFQKTFRELFELQEEKLSPEAIENNRLSLFQYDGTKEFFKQKNATYETLINVNLRKKLKAYIDTNAEALKNYSIDFRSELKSAGEAYMPGDSLQLHALSGMLKRTIVVYEEEAKSDSLKTKAIHDYAVAKTVPLRLVFVRGTGLGHYHYLIKPNHIKQKVQPKPAEQKVPGLETQCRL